MSLVLHDITNYFAKQHSLRMLHCKARECVVPENIHTSPTEGHRNSKGWWGVKGKNFEGEGGSQSFLFPEVFKM